MSTLQTIILQFRTDSTFIGKGYIHKIEPLFPKRDNELNSFNFQIDLDGSPRDFASVIPQVGSPSGDCQLLIGSYEGMKNACNCANESKCKLSESFRKRMFNDPVLARKREWNLQNFIDKVKREAKDIHPLTGDPPLTNKGIASGLKQMIPIGPAYMKPYAPSTLTPTPTPQVPPSPNPQNLSSSLLDKMALANKMFGGYCSPIPSISSLEAEALSKVLQEKQHWKDLENLGPKIIIPPIGNIGKSV